MKKILQALIENTSGINEESNTDDNVQNGNENSTIDNSTTDNTRQTPNIFTNIFFQK